ncbi:MAG: hypothetical protein MUC50_19995 [Myxococcota bacterium]|nr:hypothetical protein [Myxococcota bacterium]
MGKKDPALTKKIRVGIAALGADQARTAVRHGIDLELGTVLLAEAHILPLKASSRPTNAQVLSEVAATTAEVLASHLSNYLGSEEQKDKVSASDADFAGFIRQSIVGTESIAIDTALHAQVADGKIHHHIAKLKGKGKDDPSFGAVSLKESFPAITCNLEVAVLYPGGAHIAHRGQSSQYLIKGDKVEKLTRDYNAGGLLSSLDELGDFLPKIELKQIAMSPQDRLVIFSQGALPREPQIDPQSLQQGRSEAPEKHAAAIAQKVARNSVNPGYILVIEFIDEKKEALELSRLGKSSATQIDPQKSKASSSHTSLPESEDLLLAHVTAG